MSTTIDTNIVQMKFDNEQFEKNCAQSMSTLDKLKSKIENTSSGNSLKGLGDAAKNIDLSNIEKTIDAVNKKFSILGVVGATIVQDITRSVIDSMKKIITTVPNIIKQGGWERAMNIERAKFQLEGLHVAWQDIKGDIEYAVDGTAYGLDAAAKAASQLVASGVQVGDSMKSALRGISGVAAMTNAQYEEIAPIFTTVAGQGKLMTMQLRQLESRGLNAAAVLAESMHITEAEVREMVTQGGISFQMFSDAMDSAFGEHAKDANKTFEGVTANIRAALKKIGADFMTPIIEEEGPIVKALQRLRERINDIRKALTPVADRWRALVTMIGNDAEGLLSKMEDKMYFITSIGHGFFNILVSILSVLKPIGAAFMDIFAIGADRSLLSMAQSFNNFTHSLILSNKEMGALRVTFQGIFSVISLFGDIIKEVLSVILGLNPAAVSLREVILLITGTIGNLLVQLTQFIKQSGIIQGIGTVLRASIMLLVYAFAQAASAVADFITWINKLGVTQKILNVLSTALYLVIGAIALLVIKIKDLVVMVKNNGLESLGAFGEAIIFVKDGFLGLVSAVSQLGAVQAVLGGIATLIQKIRTEADKLFGKTDPAKEIKVISDEYVPLARNAEGATTAVKQMSLSLDDAAESSEKADNKFTAFIKKIPVGRIVALTFLASVVYTLHQITQAISNMGKGINNIGSFFLHFKNAGLWGLVTGTGHVSRVPNHILDIAIAIGTLTVSMVALSKIPHGDLDRTILTLGKLATGFVGILTVLTVLEKWLGFVGALDGIGVAMLELAAAITAMGVALNIISQVDISKIESSAWAFGTIVATITGMAVVLTKYGSGISKMGLSFIALATSMVILAEALKKVVVISDEMVKDIGALGTKLLALGTISAEMVMIAAFCDRLGGTAFLKLSVAALSLVAAIEIISKLEATLDDNTLDKLKSFIKKLWDFAGWVIIAVAAIKALPAIIGIIVTIISAVNGKLADILGQFSKSKRSVKKLTDYANYHKKALNTLANAGLVIAVTAAITVLSGVLVALTKAKLNENLPALATGIGAMSTMFGLMASFIVIMGKTLQNMKGAAAAVLASMLAMATVIVSTVGVASYIYGVFASERSIWSKVGEFGVMVASLLTILAVFRDINNSLSALRGLNVNKTTSATVTAMIASIAVIAGSVIMLSREMLSNGSNSIGSVLTSFGLIALGVEGIVKVVEQLSKLDHYTFKPATSKTILSLVAAIAAIAASLTVLSRYGGNEGMIVTSMISIGIIFGELAFIATRMSKISYKPTMMAAIKAMIVELAAVSAALVGVSQFGKSQSMVLTSMAAISATLAVFSLMAERMSKVTFTPGIFGVILAEVIALAGVSAALVAVSHFADSSDKVLAATLGINATMIAFTAVFTTISKIDTASLGKGLVAMIGVAASAVIYASSLLLLSDYTWDELKGGVQGLIATMSMFSMLTAFISIVPDIALGMISMIGVAASSYIFASSLARLAALPLDNIYVAANTLIGIVGIFTVLAGVSGVLWEPLLIGAGVIAALGVALLPFANALKITIVALTGLIDVLPNLTAAMKDLESVDILKVASALGVFTGICTGMAVLSPVFIAVSGVLATTSIAIKAFAEAVTVAANSIEKAVPKFVKAGNDIMDGLNNGILAKANTVISNIQSVGNSILSTICGTLGIASPSKKMAEIGQFILSGLTNGVSDNGMLSTLWDKMCAVGDIIENAIRNRMGIHSPSTVMEVIGNFISDGLVGGIFDTIMDFVGGGDLDTAMNSVVSGVESYLPDFESLGEQSGLNFTSGLMATLPSPEEINSHLLLPATGGLNILDANGDTLIDFGEISGDSMNNYAVFQDYWGGMSSAATTALDDISEGSGKAGKSVDRLSEQVKNLGNMLESITEVTAQKDKPVLDELVTNLKINVAEHYQWAQDIKKVMAMGYDEAVVQYLKDKGVEGRDLVKAFINGSKESIDEFRTYLPHALDIDKEMAAIIEDNFAEVGGEAAMLFYEAIENYDVDLQKMVVNLKQTVDDAIKPFEKFDDKIDITGQEMLANMHSQLDGVRKWGDNLNELVRRGVDEGIIQHFREMGPASYAEVAAMASMTDAQLQEACELWNEQLDLGQQIALEHAKTYEEVGRNITDGLALGIDPSVPTEAMEEVFKDTKEAIYGPKGWDMGSPSKLAKQFGQWIDEGLGDGIIDQFTLNFLFSKVHKMVDGTIKEMTVGPENKLNYESGKKIGKYVMDGLYDGMDENAWRIESKAAQIARDAYDAAMEALRCGSPSKLFRQLGRWIDEGWYNGLDDESDLVVDSVVDTAARMSSVISRIAENVNNEMADISPVITPKLDLTELQNGKNYIDQMFGGTSLQMANGITANRSVVTDTTEATQVAPSNNQTIIFNQTNNSPENIDPYESYRLGRNLASQLKGAFA